MTGRLKDKRWGEPYEDHRNWSMYNDRLVARGEMLIHPSFFKRWAMDLEQKNDGKEGAPFEYPDALFQYLAFVRTRTKGLDYRTLEGFTRALIEGAKPGLRIWGMKSKELGLLKAPSFSQIRRRILGLKLDPHDVSLLESDQEVYLLLDATGVKVTNRSEWIRKHGGERQSRGWLKIHLGIEDKHLQTVTLITTRERVGDVRKGPELIHRSARTIRRRGAQATRAYADGAYDSRKDFDACRMEGLTPVIKPRTTSVAHARGSPERKKRVIEYKKLGYREWADRYEYGHRWLIEAKIGAVKRLTGEYVCATTWWPMVKEIEYKFWTHDALLFHDQTGRVPWDPA